MALALTLSGAPPRPSGLIRTACALRFGLLALAGRQKALLIGVNYFGSRAELHLGLSSAVLRCAPAPALRRFATWKARLHQRRPQFVPSPDRDLWVAGETASG